MSNIKCRCCDCGAVVDIDDPEDGVVDDAGDIRCVSCADYHNDELLDGEAEDRRLDDPRHGQGDKR